MKRVILFLLCLPFIQINAQQHEKFNKSLYISGSLGIYKSTDNISQRNFGENRIGGGLGFGFRIIDNVMFYTRAQYLSKSNFHSYYNSYNLDTDLRVVNEIGTANASVSQLIVNTGLQYNLYLSKELALGILGGITYTMIDQKAKTLSGNIIRQINNEWFNGYFGGAIIEKSFKNSDLSLFAEAIYNYIDENSLYFRDAFSGMNFMIGGRYYLGG